MASKAPPVLCAVQDTRRGHLIAALAGLTASLIFIAVFQLFLRSHPEDPYRVPENEEMVLLIFSTLATIALVYAVWAFVGRRKHKRVYRLEGGELRCYDGRGLLWREPAKAYRRVRWHEKMVPRYGKYGGYHVIQALSLDHPRADRSFELHSDLTRKSALSIDDCCRLWAETLGLPVFREEADQGLLRAADELEKPLSALAAEQRLSEAFDFQAPPPAGVTWGREEAAYWAEARLSRAMTIWSLGPLLMALALFPDMEGDRQAEVTLLGLCGGLAVALLLVTLSIREGLRLTPQEAVTEVRLLGLPVLRRRWSWARSCAFAGRRRPARP